MRSPNQEKFDSEAPEGIYFWPKKFSTKDPVNWEIEKEDESGQKPTTTEAHLWFASNIKKGHELWNTKWVSLELLHDSSVVFSRPVRVASIAAPIFSWLAFR
jgi:hypothetical protein